MTDTQLYLAIGVPILANAAIIAIGFGTINARITDLRAEAAAFRAEVRTALDLLTGKVAEIDTRLSVLEDRLKH